VADPDALPEGTDAASLRRATNGYLTVTVPQDAKVYVNDYLTKSTGTERTYVSGGLQAGRTYKYEIRAEMEQNGKTVTEKKTIELRAGRTEELAFSLPSSDTIETQLTLNVPADAKVALAGEETKLTGEKRVFTTTQLSDGQQWTKYTVQVSIERDGQDVSKQETISLKAGDSKELTFDFESDRIASVR
jgi:uncharacterized protein (TIGR03000 family)